MQRLRPAAGDDERALATKPAGDEVDHLARGRRRPSAGRRSRAASPERPSRHSKETARRLKQANARLRRVGDGATAGPRRRKQVGEIRDQRPEPAPDPGQILPQTDSSQSPPGNGTKGSESSTCGHDPHITVAPRSAERRASSRARAGLPTRLAHQKDEAAVVRAG